MSVMARSSLLLTTPHHPLSRCGAATFALDASSVRRRSVPRPPRLALKVSGSTKDANPQIVTDSRLGQRGKIAAMAVGGKSTSSSAFSPLARVRKVSRCRAASSDERGSAEDGGV